MSIGKLISFNTYLVKLNNAISKLLDLEISRKKLFLSLERMEKLTEEPDEQCNIVSSELIKVKKIVFKSIKFSYDLELTIDGLCLECNSPGFYTIIGKNGSGKSTLFQLLTRLYDIDDGEIIINDRNIMTYSINELRSNISYMAKENFILNDSIINNLILDNSDITIEDIIVACKKVDMHEFIYTLDQQYNTMLGARGISLSSGQKQKLCLARILLRKSPILLLDEVTSDLDYESEKIIIEIIKEISKNTLVFCISHSRLLAEASNKIIILRNGHIIQTGSHQELMNSNNYYKELIENS
jgi:ABC-type bacteriocin/lantibiotic exporter with double-glycine peptidase domain